MSDKKATLSFDDKTVEFPIYTPTLGQDVVDVSSLGGEGLFTYDPGFMATASCESKITFIDGGKGKLLYRGYPIEQLAEHSSFLEVSYLLLHGELPTQSQLESFEKKIKEYGDIDPVVENVFKAFHHDAHPMAMMMAASSALSGLYPTNITDEAARIDTVIRLIAKVPTLVAMCKRHNAKEAFLKPRTDLNYAENFLHLLNGKDDNDNPNKLIASALDRIFILHADHEQNASTSTVRLSGSTGTQPYAAFTAGVSALWGPAHGGANEAALHMLEEIGDESKIDEYVLRAKDKKDPFRLMGFGHRVYKNFDPRAKIMRDTCHDILDEVGAHDDPLFKVAMKLQDIALSDEYFVSRKLYPNVDFYSGITQSAIGIPTNLFTNIFVLGRTPGWMSHWHEMLSAPYKIGRPRQLYDGYDSRDYKDVEQR